MTLGTFYRAPSVKRLMESMGLDRAKASDVRALLHGVKDPDAYERVQNWVAACYTHPPYIERLLSALDEACGTFGVEYLGGDHNDWKGKPEFAYLNTGDTYAPTLVYSYEKDSFFVSTMGDVRERNGLE